MPCYPACNFNFISRCYLPALLLLSACLMLVAGCADNTDKQEQCLYCHKGIETASASHSGCISCHGGNPQARTKEEAHRGIYGIANRSFPGRYELGCGKCHKYQLERMQSSQMYTAAGMIAQIQATWEGEEPGVRYGSQQAELFNQSGLAVKQQAVSELDNLSGELFRKFCARCHVARQQDPVNGSGNPAGCAACHFPYTRGGVYRGSDPTMKGRSPHSQTHEMHTLPGINSCYQCHHRSGRIALSYQGLMDGNNGLVPTVKGQQGPVKGSDQRNFTRITPDVHHQAGMDCIDCHTSREIMGEGYASANLHGQLEVACEDCHGSATRLPAYTKILRENEEPVRESRAYKLQVRPGMEMVVTSKGRPFSNVLHVDGNVLVQVKGSGKILRSKIITNTPEHTVVGHERLHCNSCHSRTVVQCYGCHTRYDKQEYHYDFIKGVATKGLFSESEDYRTLYPFPLALNSKGQISPVTPGCQTFVTVVEEDGTMAKDEEVAFYKGKRQLRFAPFFGHNIGKKAIGCSQCHGNPAFLGFGQHVVEGRDIKGTLLCEKSDHKPLDGFVTMEDGDVYAYSAITRENARPLDTKEIQRVLAVNSCLVCHSSPKDQLYRKRIDYRDLDDPLHRFLLAPR